MSAPTKPVVSGPSVADLLWLDERFSPDDRARLERIFGPPPDAAIGVAEAEIKDAYDAGWDDGQEAIEIDRQPAQDRDFEHYLKRKNAP